MASFRLLTKPAWQTAESDRSRSVVSTNVVRNGRGAVRGGCARASSSANGRVSRTNATDNTSPAAAITIPSRNGAGRGPLPRGELARHERGDGNGGVTPIRGRAVTFALAVREVPGDEVGRRLDEPECDEERQRGGDDDAIPNSLRASSSRTVRSVPTIAPPEAVTTTSGVNWRQFAPSPSRGRSSTAAAVTARSAGRRPPRRRCRRGGCGRFRRTQRSNRPVPKNAPELVDRDLSRCVLVLPMRCSLLRIAGKERIAVDVVDPGIPLAPRLAERVDGVTDRDNDEADLLEHRRPSCARQASGDSARPQVDVAQCLRWNRLAVGDVGELQRTARSKHTPDLTKHGALV